VAASVAGAHSCVADALARRAGWSAAASTNGCCGLGLVGGGDRPAEAGKLAGHRDSDQRAALAALGVKPLPAAMQAPLRLPADRDDMRGLILLVGIPANVATEDCSIVVSWGPLSRVLVVES
jgi:hypothetical protein